MASSCGFLSSFVYLFLLLFTASCPCLCFLLPHLACSCSLFSSFVCFFLWPLPSSFSFCLPLLLAFFFPLISSLLLQLTFFFCPLLSLASCCCSCSCMAAAFVFPLFRISSPPSCSQTYSSVITLHWITEPLHFLQIFSFFPLTAPLRLALLLWRAPSGSLGRRFSIFPGYLLSPSIPPNPGGCPNCAGLPFRHAAP